MLRDILKHSMIYGVANAAQRAIGFLLLPLYTHHLTPADYGVVGLLDVFVTVIGTMGQAGIVAAVTRASFNEPDEVRQSHIWWTALFLQTIQFTTFLSICWVFRAQLAGVIFGSTEEQFIWYLSLTIVSMYSGFLQVICTAYLRVQKRSISLATVALSIALLGSVLNIVTIAVLEWGVVGFLVSNIVTNGLSSGILLFLAFRGRPFGIRWEVTRGFWAFGWPIMVVNLSVLTMNEADRYLIRLLVNDLAQVGLFSLALKLVSGVNLLLLYPFSAAWSVSVYEVNALENRLRVFRTVFRYYAFVTAWVFIGLALFSETIIYVIAAPDYSGAAELMPVLCIGAYVFGLNSMLASPALIHRRTVTMASAAMLAAVINIGLNVLVIPHHGAWGAAWVMAFTNLVYVGFGHWQFRSIEALGFELRMPLLCVLLGSGAMVVSSLGVPEQWGILERSAMAALLYCLVTGMMGWLLWSLGREDLQVAFEMVARRWRRFRVRGTP